VKKRKQIPLDFLINKLTNSIEKVSKTQLIDHYIKTLGAFHFGGRLMIIETQAALKLIDKYFKNEE